MKVVAFLPVKGTSVRIENKNLKLLDGKPLFVHTLEKLCECDFIDEVYLDSESESILDLVDYLPYKKFKRDPSFATNSTDGNSLLLNQIANTKADIVIQILCTSPFIEIETIRKGVECLKADATYDSCVLVKRDKQYTWNDRGPNYDFHKIPNSVNLPDTIIETMGLYIIRKEAALNLKRRIGDSVYLLEATPTEAIDVNFGPDFELANLIAAGRREKERLVFRNLKTHLSSAVLSDILQELGINSVISSLKPNISGTKLMGRAKTLKLRSLRENESYKGIYTALKSYEELVPDDIIVVERELPHLAYFGELNATLSLRAGVAGVIVGGNTRDSEVVKQLGLPVFSRGQTCRDVKGASTVAYMSKPISIEGVSVFPGDLVFADSEGIVVIPRKQENQIIALALAAIRTEQNIRFKILQGFNPLEILAQDGEF